MKQIQQELWPVTLGEARAHRYATWEKSRGYRYQEGDCTVAVDKGALAFQCSGRIDKRYARLCRKHGEQARSWAKSGRQQTPLFTVPGLAGAGGRLP